MVITVNQADVDLALRLSPAHNTIHFFNNPVAIAFMQAAGVDYCAATENKLHAFKPGVIDYIQDLSYEAKELLARWKRERLFQAPRTFRVF